MEQLPAPAGRGAGSCRGDWKPSPHRALPRRRAERCGERGPRGPPPFARELGGLGAGLEAMEATARRFVQALSEPHLSPQNVEDCLYGVSESSSARNVASESGFPSYKQRTAHGPRGENPLPLPRFLPFFFCSAFLLCCSCSPFVLLSGCSSRVPVRPDRLGP